MTAQPVTPPVAPPRTRRTLAGVVLVGLVLSAPSAWADIQFSAKSEKKDGSQPPSGTVYSGDIDGDPPLPTPDPVAFPGTYEWTSEGEPPPEPQEHVFGGVVSTPADFYCGPQVCTGAVHFYTTDSDTKTCSGSCNFTTKHWARFGSVSGTVTLTNGAPVRGLNILAGDPVSPGFWSKLVQTDANGAFTFTSATAKIYPFIFQGYIDFPIPASNNWGLHLDQPEPDTPPHKVYSVGVTNHVTDVDVQSSQAANVSIVLTLEEVEALSKEEPPNLRCGGGESEEEAGEDCSAGGSVACPGEPISVLTGNVFFDQTDAFLPGTVPLSLRRSYNSADAYRGRSGLFGPGWSSTYERELVVLRSGIVGIKKSNGNHSYFTERTPGTFGAYNAASGRSTISQDGPNWARTLLSGRRETYGANGRLTGLADPVGNTTTFERNASGAITGVVAPGGRRLSLAYKTVANQIRIGSVSGPEGLIASYGYDTAGRLVRVTYPDGSGYAYSYDNNGQLLQMRDGAGVVLESHTYAEGKGITSERSGGVERLTFTYGEGRTTVRDALGNDTHYDWSTVDSVKLLKKITGPCGGCGSGGSQTQEWTYDDTGRIASYKDGLEKVWSYTYDASGNQDTVTDPLNRTTTFTFDERGRALTVTPPGGGARVFTYTAAGLATGANPLGHTLSLGRSTQGAITSLTTARGKTYTFGRNSHGDVVSVQNPLHRTTTYELDGFGRPTAVIDPLTHRTTLRYDLRGRLAGVALPTGVGEWSTRYDKGGRAVERTDPLGRKTRYAYDAHGRLASVVDPAHGVTRFHYNAMSRVTDITDANGHNTHRQLDAYGRVTSITFADQRVESYTYDAAGRLHTSTDRRGTVITYHRDDLGRVTEKAFSDGSPSVTYHYDARGRLDGAANGADTLTWAFDDADRLLSEGSTANSSQVSYTYDDDGQRLSLSLDGAELVTYGWNDLGGIGTLTRSGHTFTFGYDDANRRTSLAYPNGVNTSYAYDDDSQLASLTTVLGLTTLSGAGYTYDAIGNRLAKTTPEFGETYGYDALDRLVGAERNGGVPGHGHYAYDAVDNRVSSQTNEAVETATFDQSNRLLSRTGGGELVVQGQLDEPGQARVNGAPASMLEGNAFEATVPAAPGTNDFEVQARDTRGNQRTSTYRVDVPAAADTYLYDDNGNLTQKVDGSATWTYEWSAENELRRVLKDGVEIARFVYDPMGRRIEKVAGGATIRFIYDGLDIVRETHSGAEIADYRYVHGPGSDEPLAREEGDGTFTYYHADGLGSVVSMTDASGAVTFSRRYDAWGRIEQGAERPGFAFTGREWDPEIGLYFYRARYYDPQTGRFISEDPIGIGTGLEQYAYVGNDPVGYRDPSGKVRIKVGGYVITVHKNDPDPFPSSPHGHIYPSAKKVNIETGEIVLGEKVVGRLASKELATLRGALRRVGLIAGVLFLTIDTADAYAADCGHFGPNTKRSLGRSIGGLAGAWAGGMIGAKAGGAIGTAIEPGGGTAVGAFVGGLVGGIVGGLYGEDAGEYYVEE